MDPKLHKQIDLARLPGHVAIIMDGNGRWAKKNFLPRVEGHRRGVKAVDRIVTLCRNLDIKALTLYAFSDENWNRPELEISALMKILDFYLKKELARMQEENIRFNTIGRIDDLPEDIQKIIQNAREATQNNDGMVLTLALSYGGRQEIVDAAKKVAENVKAGFLEVDEIDASLFASYLSSHPLPDPDLLIRTSGELRVSNFLLYQIAYTELHYTPVLWPDFSEDDFLEAVIDFQKRERRFGLIQEQIVKA
ncbi:Undecaprenyl diphosphate synthase [hydrothermal vent metagenome]|uniref:Undecaprenyl diphosphate synthase n=1 Tax=hydrothermal vent metagenome TaxID=652676 RepID=A0A3B1CTN7_9ZZZZ